MHNNNLFKQLNKILLLDGASGTMMIEAGLEPGVCPELFAAENPELISSLHRSYFEAGSDVVYTFTFGGNRLKLEHFGLDSEGAFKLNLRLAEIASEERNRMREKYPLKDFYVAGDMGPCGQFLLPAGDKTFDELTKVFADQASALALGGVDFFVVETMMDLNEARAAVAGIRSVSDLPIMLSMTFEKGGRSLSGNTPEAALVSLSAMGVSAFGANCSTGPDEMVKIIKTLTDATSMPVMAKPNAGMPIVVDGKTLFPMQTLDFTEGIKDLLEAGARIVGGCCGTSPDYIKSISEMLYERDYTLNMARQVDESVNEDLAGGGYISSSSLIAKVDFDNKGNPRERTVSELLPLSTDDLTDMIMDAADDEPDFIIIDFLEISRDSRTDAEELGQAVAMAAMMCPYPLAVKNIWADLLEEVAKYYPGRPAFLGNEGLWAANDIAETTPLRTGEMLDEDMAKIQALSGRFGFKVV